MDIGVTRGDVASGKFKSVSLFSGAMGLDIGIEQSDNFETIAAVEKIPSFVKTIRTNIELGNLKSKECLVLEKDLHDFSPEELMEMLGIVPGELDLLVGGPPCQSFSTAGKRGTTQDRRGTLLWRFLHFVEVMRPKFFLMENVRGLMSAALKHRPIKERPKAGGPPLEPEEERGSVVKQFVEDLPDEYRIDCFEVNSVNYGAPQIRERALFVGNRMGQVVDFEEPTHFGLKYMEELHANGHDFSKCPNPQPHTTLRDALDTLSENEMDLLDFSPRKKEFLELVPEGGNWRCLEPDKAQEIMKKAYFAKGGRSGWLRRLSWDLPSPTILAMPNHASTSLCHPSETRVLSLRESARVQGFPDKWEFSGTIQEKYAQVGNAVPVILGEVSGNVISRALERREGESAPSDLKFRKTYIMAHIRTRKYFENGSAVVRDPNNPDSSNYSSPKTKIKIS